MLDLMLCVRTSVLTGTKMEQVEAGSAAGDATPNANGSNNNGNNNNSSSSNSNGKMANGGGGGGVVSDKLDPMRMFVYDLNRAGSDHRIHVMDYAPALFHQIRQSCGVSSSAFLLAWSSNDIRSAQVDGSDLIYSCDKKFVAKPLLDKDCNIVLDMLPRYAEYMAANPNSFLLRMMAMLRVSRGKKMVPYLVVQNFFHFRIPLHFMFQIAGSTSGVSDGSASSNVLSRVSSTLKRRSSSLSKTTLTRPRPFTRSRSSSLVLDPPAFAKDKHAPLKATVFGNEASWKSTGRTILVEKSLRALFVQQMERDLAFLRDAGITDHQIVIGIHEGEPMAPPSPDVESKRLVKVPSMVVFQSNSPPAIVSKKKGGGSGSGSGSNSLNNSASKVPPVSPPTENVATLDLSNLRRARRVSVQSMDSEPISSSPFRSMKGGIHSKTDKREELYYIGITDIFAVNRKDKKRNEKAVARFNVFKDWLEHNLECFDGPERPPQDATTPVKSVAAFRGARSSTAAAAKVEAAAVPGSTPPTPSSGGSAISSPQVERKLELKPLGTTSNEGSDKDDEEASTAEDAQ